ncbi:MAG TPA: head GIN domain-containing protein [Flavisolibacter sp.]|jgi:hypothetical protein|nr:head GIN domain-containing protein [Flavisolibacter sp.]
MRVLFTTLMLASLALGSCRFMNGEKVRGDGHITTEQRSVGNFNGLDVSGAITVRVRQDAAAGVKIEADQNLLQYIDVHIEGSTLHIRTKDGYNLDPSKDIVAYVSAPQYRHLQVSGACNIVGETALTGTETLEIDASGASDINLQVNVPKVDAEMSGAGSLIMKGQATEFSAHVSGSSDIKCMDLVTDNASLDLSGASEAEITANKKLDIDASGSSSVQYKGNANVNSKSSGASSVNKVG